MKKKILGVCVAIVAMSVVLEAKVKTVCYYRMGEADSNAANEEQCDVMMEDEMGYRDLNVRGRVYYSTDVPPAKKLRSKKPSKFSCKLDQQGFGGFKGEEGEDPIFVDRNNTGIEAWIKVSGDHVHKSDYVNVLSAGGGSKSINIAIGDGETIGPHIQNYWGSVDFPIEREQWTHVALVYDDGLFLFYINGEELVSKPIGLEDATFHNIPAIGLYMDGWVDEVRFFEFEPGMFDPDKDLNYK